MALAREPPREAAWAFQSLPGRRPGPPRASRAGSQGASQGSSKAFPGVDLAAHRALPRPLSGVDLAAHYTNNNNKNKKKNNNTNNNHSISTVTSVRKTV